MEVEVEASGLIDDAKISRSSDQSLLRSKRLTPHDILAIYVKSTGYYEVEGVDLAHQHLTEIWNYDGIELDEVPYITGKVNIYSRKDLREKLIKNIIDLNIDKCPNVEKGLVVQGIDQI